MIEIITMPQLGETVTEGKVLRWLVKVGDIVKTDDPILEISTDKVDTEVPSPFEGKVTSLFAEEGETVEVGAPLLELEVEGDTPVNIPEEQLENQNPRKEVINKVKQETKEPLKEDVEQNLSPIVRKLVSENKIDLSKIVGTGTNQRITRKDIESHIASSKDEKTIERSESTDSDSKEQGKQPIPRLRKKIAENMIMSKQTSAHVMTSVEVDYEGIEQFREKYKEGFKEAEGFSLTYLPFIAKATEEALRKYPIVNSSFDLEKGEFIIHEEVNLGIAVDLNQKGLLVGTIPLIESYNIVELARKISEISNLLREEKYKVDNVTGSTFTISNNGSFNSFLTSPIINQPNVGILSTESVKKRPVVIEDLEGSDSIMIRHVGILSLTWDHRVFDGSTALLFLNSIKEKLEKSDWKGELE
tara:strand:+ start:554 stop:1801 length:1248 start_codon:yes stop_codon:yes gene_type:complete